VADEKTHADSLWEWLTGAASDGGAQTDPDLSLGDYRSATEAQPMDVAVASPIANITIEYAAGGNAEGAGTLNAVDANNLAWKDLGGAYGASVAIANGETKIVEASADTAAYLRVTRTSATALTGTATVTLTRKLNNVFGFDDVTSAEAVAGDDEYRATMLVNESAGSITLLKRWIGVLGTQAVSDTTQLGASGAGTIVTTDTFADWPDSGWCHIRNAGTTQEIVYYTERTDTVLTVPAAGRGLLGTSASAGAVDDTLDAVPGIRISKDDGGVTAAGGAIEDVGDEDTEPAGAAWNTGLTAATGLDIGTMTTGQQIGIWFHREIPAGAVATTEAHVIIHDSFDAA